MAGGMLAAFALWTVLVCLVDVQAIGPGHSAVGFAAINRWFHDLTGVHMTLYVITDWLSLMPAGIVVGFAMLGLGQWIARKDIRKVDNSLLALGGFYMAVLGAYLFFEEFVVNYRPVWIEGVLEASYPSSTTMLVMCVMPTAMMQMKERIKSCAVRRFVLLAMGAYMALMVAARLASGVHWLSDIIGGMLLSAGFVMLYDAVVNLRN